MRFSGLAGLVGLAVCLLTPTAHAYFILVASARNVAPTLGQTSFTAGSFGTNVQLDLHLVEDTGATFFAGSAQVRLTQGGVLPGGTETALAIGPGFNAFTPPATSVAAGVLSFNNEAALPKIQSTTSGGISYVKIGQFDVLPNQGVASPATTYAWTDFAPPPGSNIFASATAAFGDTTNLIASDAALLGRSPAFSVSAVPEPSSIGLLALVGCVGTVVRRRR